LRSWCSRSRRSSGAAMCRAISPPATAPSRAATIRPIQSGAVTWGMKNRIFVSRQFSTTKRKTSTPSTMPRTRRGFRRVLGSGFIMQRVCHFPDRLRGPPRPDLAALTRQSTVASSGTGGPSETISANCPRGPFDPGVSTYAPVTMAEEIVNRSASGQRATGRVRSASPSTKGRGGGTRCTSASAHSS
jgi:hypothetical protein